MVSLIALSIWTALYSSLDPTCHANGSIPGVQWVRPVQFSGANHPQQSLIGNRGSLTLTVVSPSSSLLGQPYMELASAYYSGSEIWRLTSPLDFINFKAAMAEHAPVHGVLSKEIISPAQYKIALKVWKGTHSIPTLTYEILDPCFSNNTVTNRLNISRDGQKIVAMVFGGCPAQQITRILVFTPESNQPQAMYSITTFQPATSSILSSDGRYLFFQSTNFDSIVDLTNGSVYSQSHDPVGTEILDFSPTGDRYASTRLAGSIYVANLQGLTLTSSFEVHPDVGSNFFGVGISPEDNTLATLMVGTTQSSLKFAKLNIYRTDQPNILLQSLPLITTSQSILVTGFRFAGPKRLVFTLSSGPGLPNLITLVKNNLGLWEVDWQTNWPSTAYTLDTNSSGQFVVRAFDSSWNQIYALFDPVSRDLVFDGIPQAGSEISVTAYGNPGQPVYLFRSTGIASVPILQNGIAGVLYLNPTGLTRQFIGTIGSNGTLQNNILIQASDSNWHYQLFRGLPREYGSTVLTLISQ